MKISGNQVEVSGAIVGEFSYNNEVHGENFYTSKIAVKRLSGVDDVIPIVVSERLVEVDAAWSGQKVKISGSFRSYNESTETGKHLKLFVFADEFDNATDCQDNRNKILLNGHICRETTYRKTPYGREIADILLAVNRKYGKSDYIPCIAWGRNAIFASEFNIGNNILLEGRVQSRNYQKKTEDGTYETRTAYEVSATSLELIVEKDEVNDQEGLK